MWFDKFKRYFDEGVWSESMVADAVVKGKISESQYAEIIGHPYQGGQAASNLTQRVTALEEELTAAKIVLGVGDAPLVEHARMTRSLLEKGAQSLPDVDLMQMPSILPKWEDLVASAYVVEENQVPFKFQYNGEPYKCIKAGQNFQAQWVPGLNTSSIFTRIAPETESGTVENPITAARGMEYTYGLYYLDPENGKTYLCKRGDETGSITLYALPHEQTPHYFQLVT